MQSETPISGSPSFLVRLDVPLLKDSAKQAVFGLNTTICWKYICNLLLCMMQLTAMLHTRQNFAHSTVHDVNIL